MLEKNTECVVSGFCTALELMFSFLLLLVMNFPSVLDDAVREKGSILSFLSLSFCMINLRKLNADVIKYYSEIFSVVMGSKAYILVCFSLYVLLMLRSGTSTLLH